MADLEQRLRALAGEAFPPVPDVRAAVAERVAAQERAAPRRARSVGRLRVPSPTTRSPGAATTRRRALLLAAILVLVPAAAAAAVPETRHAILDWLGLRHVRVERVPTVPASAPFDSADLGRRVATVADASRHAGFDVAVPRALGRPDAVYVTADGVVSLAYEPRPGLPADRLTGLGLLVTELRAGPLPDYVAKAAGPRTRVEPVRVDGAHGVFLSGEPHELLIERPDGTIHPLPARLAGNVLAFERGELVTRLEGRFDRLAALALARSLRSG